MESQSRLASWLTLTQECNTPAEDAQGHGATALACTALSVVPYFSIPLLFIVSSPGEERERLTLFLLTAFLQCKGL